MTDEVFAAFQPRVCLQIFFVLSFFFQIITTALICSSFNVDTAIDYIIESNLFVFF